VAPDLLRIVWRLLEPSQRRQLVGLQFLSIVMALSTATGVAAVLPFLTMLADPRSLEHHPALHSLYVGLGFTDSRTFVVALGIAFAAGVALANALNLFGSLAIDRFAYSVGNSLNVSLFAEYLHRDYGFHARTSAALLTNNVLHETGRITNGILRHGLILCTGSVTVALIVASVLMFEPLLGGIAFLGLAAAYAGVYALVRRKLRRNGRVETREYMERTKLVGDSFGAVKEIVLSQAQRSLVERFARSCATIAVTGTSTLAVAQTPRYVLETVMVCALVAMGLLASHAGAPDPSWVASLSFTALAVYRLLPALQQAFAALVRIRADRHALDSIAEDLKQARARPAATPVRDKQAWRRRPREAIRLKSVSFRYAEDRAAAVDALNLEIPAGALVGLVGPNGSGKTTLVDLICGLLVPQTGCIEIDGIRLSETNRSVWQSIIAYVPQQIFVCDCTLAENIALGVPAAEIDRERLHRAVQLARLESYVASLPRGYDEVLGGRGSQASGGQRQQLGIARALYRDASVFVMDEPTSALDQAAEHDLVEMLAAGRGERTTVLVTHRPSTLRHCDVVYELAKGQIVRRRVDYLTEGTYAS
jgi:ATP-binding cassette, subfamily B, bacterial PglK